MGRKSKVLKGAFDAQAIAEVEILQDTFSINVKNDEGESVYQNKEEPYSYPKMPSIQTVFEYYGALLSEDQKNFLTEALSGGEDTGKAVAKVVQTINDALKADAKSAAYAKVFNANKPVTEEAIDNAYARMVRSLMKTANVSDETAYQRLNAAGIVPAEYTLDMFRANKSKV
jgi:hypothetical protein